VIRNLGAISNSLFEELIYNYCFLFLFIAFSKTDVTQWCTEHEYELLELEKSATSETDDDEDNEDNHRK
jgi:hypothetical protein